MNHTFSNFIVGPSNRLAHQAALAVAGKPGAAYNPLLIRAASGSGKTHLLHAIGDHTRRDPAPCRVVYLTPRSLSHTLHQALRNGHIEATRNQYVQADILLLDDLQDIVGMDHTQKMLVGILDELVRRDRQVVMASTTMPHDITSLEPRLSSRLGSSAIVDIQPPEAETRFHILRHKAAMHHVALSESAAELVAAGPGANVRELENRLARLAAYASLHERPIDDTLVREVLSGEPPADERKLSLIQRTVASYFGVGTPEIKTKRRTRALLVPRQIAMHLSHELTGLSVSEIGRLFGGHSTASVQHAFRRIQQLTHRDASVARAVGVLRDMLANPGVDNSDISFPQGGLKRMCG